MGRGRRPGMETPTHPAGDNMTSAGGHANDISLSAPQDPQPTSPRSSLLPVPSPGEVESLGTVTAAMAFAENLAALKWDLERYEGEWQPEAEAFLALLTALETGADPLGAL